MKKILSFVFLAIVSILCASNGYAEDAQEIPADDMVTTKMERANSNLLPPSALAPNQIAIELSAEGYTDIKDLKFKEGKYHANAKNGDGQQVMLQIDTLSGKVLKSDPIQQ